MEVTTGRSVLRKILFASLGPMLVASGTCSVAAEDAASSYRALWTREQAPLRIYGNTYYVGTRGLSSVLVTSDEGHVLIDGTLPENAKLIVANIRALGFRVEDVKLIMNSHAHSDHAGGIAELQRLTGATVAASDRGAAAMKRGRGGQDDPQFEHGDAFPPIKNVRIVRDRHVLKVGGIEITVQYTPGHTPGGTSWTWQSCEGERCLNMVYGDSLTAVSDNSFKFTGDPRYPTALQDLTRSIERIESLPCDILITAHPDFAGLWQRVERREKGDANALADPQACERYAEAGRVRLNERVSHERTR
jgi:metallo-beta-lactamase class B